MMKTASRSSVAVSLGRRLRKRMTASPAESDPATIASPSTSSAFAKSEPRIEVCATTTSPAESAKRTTKSSGRLPRVDCRTPVSAAPKRAPTASVAFPIAQARPASPAAAHRKTATGSASAKWSTPVRMQSARIPAKSAAVERLKPNKAHSLVHGFEGRRARFSGLLRANFEEPVQLGLVVAQLLVAPLDRREQLDDRLGHAFLERAVAVPVELRLHVADRASR